MPTPDSIDGSQNGDMKFQESTATFTTDGSKRKSASCFKRTSPSSRKPKSVHFVITPPASNSPQDSWNSDHDEAYMSPAEDLDGTVFASQLPETTGSSDTGQEARVSTAYVSPGNTDTVANFEQGTHYERLTQILHTVGNDARHTVEAVRRICGDTRPRPQWSTRAHKGDTGEIMSSVKGEEIPAAIV